MDQEPPKSPQELMEKIKEDYVLKNYLWTGDIYTPAFELDCEFKDPTLTFTGTDTFIRNVQNLVPIVEFFTSNGSGNRSDLLDISINDEKQYIQTRWNMVGDLSTLPWRPKIDVIGRTKFWYRKVEDGVFRVYFYDEEWEIPAAKALLQLVTRPGTIRNTDQKMV